MSFSKNGLFDTFSIFIYTTTAFIFLKLKPEGVSLYFFIFLTTYLLLDSEFKFYELYIRSGGTDALTYESYARDILEGDYLRGGESVYFNSGSKICLVFSSHCFW